MVEDGPVNLKLYKHNLTQKKLAPIWTACQASFSSIKLMSRDVRDQPFLAFGLLEMCLSK